MKTDVSFIISIDSSFEMLNNFFEHLLQDEFALNSEIIVILDAITNCNIITYIKNLSKQTPNIKVYISDKKLGYGKANAYGHFPRPSGPRSPARQGHIKRPVLRLAEPSFLRPANQCC